MKLEDLTSYDYDPPRFEGELAVGWLDGDTIESTGRVEPHKAHQLFVQRLTFAAAFLQSSGMDWMGTHGCTFCDGPELPLRQDGRASWGNGEFRVLSRDGTIYVAPTLIAHYVEAHDYLPPEEFVEAVFTGSFIEEEVTLDPIDFVVRTVPAPDELRAHVGNDVEVTFFERSPWNSETARPMIGLTRDLKVYGPWDGSLGHATEILEGDYLIFDVRSADTRPDR